MMMNQIRKMFKHRRKTVGLALGSGGIRGLAHVGVINTLVENGIPIDYISGTSIGAWVGAHYALYEDIERLEEYTVGKRREKLHSMFELTLNGGFIRGAKVEALLKKWLADADFSMTRIPLKVVATDLLEGGEVIFSEGKIAPAIWASMAVPSIFSPYEHMGKTLVDGGVCNPVPVNVLGEMGADVIIAVNLDNYIQGNHFTEESVGSIPKVTSRSIDLLRHHLAQHSVKDADVVIEPENASEELSSWRNYFTQNIGEIHLDIGKRAAEEKLDQVFEALYGRKVRRRKADGV